MELLSVNLSGATRRETLNGRTYLVAPATMLVSGVLNGSKGPLFYPEDEIEKNPGIWNGVPITKGHPTDNGNAISARHPSILERYGLGYVFNDRYEGGKRIAELWFDEQLTKERAPKTYAKLDAREPSEVSTGLYTDDYPAQNGAAFNGKGFDYVARNYRPDHLAVLEDEIGACSIKDGCGVLVNEEFSEENLSTIQRFLGWLTGNLKPGQPHSQVTGRFKRMGSGTGKGPVHEAAQRGAMVLSDRDKELGTLAQQELSETGHNPPGFAVDEGLWERAKGEADKGGYSDDQYWAVVSHIYTRMGGTIAANQQPVINSEGIDMATRQQNLQYLTTNCDCGIGKDTLNKMTDEELEKLRKTAAALNAVTKGVPVQGGMTLVFNAEKEKMVYKNADGEECDPEKDEGCKKMEENMADNQAKPATIQEWEASMPAAARPIWNAAKAVEKERRQSLVKRLVANLEGDAQKKMATKLLGKSVEDLEELASLIPASGQANNADEDLSFLYSQPSGHYAGAAGAPYYAANAEEIEVLDIESERHNYDPVILNRKN